MKGNGMVKRVFGMLGGAMVGVTSFGANLQTFVLGATPVGTLEALEAGAEYSISSEVEFLHFRDLVNDGKVDPTATITLTESLDLTEGGEYTHGYCDKPTRDKDGKVVGWYEAEEKDGGTVEWTVAEPDLTGTKDIDEKTEKLEENGKYVIRGKEGYNKFMEPKCKNWYPEGISVVMLGDMNENGNFVEVEKDENGDPIYGYWIAKFGKDGGFKYWDYVWESISTSGMTDIDEETQELKENGEYVIRGKEGYNRFMELKEERGKLKDEDGNYPSGISVVLLGSVDADDKFVEPVKDEEGKLLSGWCEAQFDKEAALCKFRNWIDAGEMIGDKIDDEDWTKEITGATEALKKNVWYVIKGADGYKKFLKLKDENGNYPAKIEVFLRGSVDENGNFVEPEKDENGEPIGGWREAKFDVAATLCKFRNWKETGNGGGRYTPIGLGDWHDGRDCFAAKFDGGGHEIKLTINIEVENSRACAGMFGCVGEGGEIKNLGVAEGSYIRASINNDSRSDSSAGGIAGRVGSGATISDCTNSGEFSASGRNNAGWGNSSAGGIVGKAEAGATISDCTNSGDVSASGINNAGWGNSSAGGIVGKAEAGATISDCTNSGEFSASGINNDGWGNSSAGGIVGKAEDGAMISDCTNSGEFSASGINNAGWGNSSAGGIVGKAEAGATISDCTNSGEFSASGSYKAGWSNSSAGGIAGWAGMGATITGCHNDGNGTVSVSGRNNAGRSNSSAGGIVGKAEAGATVSGCSNAGEVKASAGSSAGGIAGFASGTISNCPNNGVVSASDGGLAGGIAGQVSGAISDCNNAGKVTASDGGSAGGIAGKTEDGATVRNCRNTGTVSASNDGFAGGIVGEASSDLSFYGKVTISDSYNVGAVTAGDDGHAGGIAGKSTDDETISGCYYLQKDADNPNGTKSGVGDDGKAKVAKVARARSRSIAAYADEDTGGEAQCLGMTSEEAKGEKLASDLSGSSKKSEVKLEKMTLEVVRNSEYGAGVETLGDAQKGLEKDLEKEKKKAENAGSAGNAENDDKKNEIQSLLGKVYSVIEVRNSNPERKDAFAHIDNELVANWWELELKEKKERFPAEVEKIKAEVTKLGQIHGVSVGKELEKLDKIKKEAGDAVTNEQIDGKMLKAQGVLDTLKAKLEALAEVEKIKTEVTKLGQLYGVSVGKELEKLDKIKKEAGDAVTNEQIDGKMLKAQGVLAEFLDSIQDKEKNIGHASSGVGGQAGFYKAPNGVVTFRVKPNPGYKVSEIITSGGTKIKPGAVVKTLPERVTVRFEKV